MRNSIRLYLERNGFIKKSKTEIILGCSFDEFKYHLESKFETWMNWSNHGKFNGEYNHGWDIDHIVPLSSTINIDEVLKLNHYTNLQPLCSKINRDIKKDIYATS
jgi:5-methylcytosine-specific restriction endonuclease McrA